MLVLASSCCLRVAQAAGLRALPPHAMQFLSSLPSASCSALAFPARVLPLLLLCCSDPLDLTVCC